MLYQILVPATAEFVFLLFIPILIIVEIISFKIGLIVVKAEEKRGFKWVVISVLIQIGVIFFLSLPIIFIGLIGEMLMGQSSFIIILTIIFALFIDINVVNVIHKLGIKRALIAFIFFLAPIIIIGFIMVYNLSALGFFS